MDLRAKSSGFRILLDFKSFLGRRGDHVGGAVGKPQLSWRLTSRLLRVIEILNGVPALPIRDRPTTTSSFDILFI